MAAHFWDFFMVLWGSCHRAHSYWWYVHKELTCMLSWCAELVSSTSFPCFECKGVERLSKKHKVQCACKHEHICASVYVYVHMHGYQMKNLCRAESGWECRVIWHRAHSFGNCRLTTCVKIVPVGKWFRRGSFHPQYIHLYARIAVVSGIVCFWSVRIVYTQWRPELSAQWYTCVWDMF